MQPDSPEKKKPSSWMFMLGAVALYFRKNQVTRAPSQTEDQALYAGQGASFYEDFDGGPCFREDKQGSWLVGIASLRTGQALSFTSTFLYRDWLRAIFSRRPSH